MSFNFTESDRCLGGSRRSAAGILQIHVGFRKSEDPNKITINWTLLDTHSTASVGNNRNIAGAVNNFTEDEIMVVHTNGGSKTFTKISPLNPPPLDIQINEYYM